MEITSVKITIVPDEDRLKAYASVIFDECFVVHDLKIINTENKIFVAMPSRRYKNVFRDIAHPLDKETRKKYKLRFLQNTKRPYGNSNQMTKNSN